MIRKRFFYALLLSFISIILAAQTPMPPFVEEGKTWLVLVSDHQMGSVWEKHFGGINYFIQGDTVIGSQVCQKVYSSHYVEEAPIHHSDTTYYASLYEKDNRVYLYAPDSDEAGLLYDFSLEEGESATFRLVDYLDARLAKDTVLTVTERAVVTGTLPDDEPGTKRTFVRLTLSGKSTDGQASEPTQWFAGIGDAYGPFCTGARPKTAADFDYFKDVGTLIPGYMVCQTEKGIVFETGFQETGVGINHINPGTQTTVDGAIYDLNGRRLGEAPKQGIYIQGRKKRLAR